ncbi:TM186 protein, partial [Acromyrmex charruanus]
MYSRLLSNLCERFLYRVSNSVRYSNIKTLSHVANKNEEKQKVEIVSTKFPDYEVIYMFPFVKQACGLNVVKYRFTIFAGVATPVIIGLHLANFLPFDVTSTSIAVGVLTTMWLHIFGFLCNNLIGCVYLKLDEKKVILSYIDYWGKRIDLKVFFNEIYPMSDNSISITDPLYKKIILTSQTEILKINMKFGRIIDVDKFRCILGMA